MVAVEAPDASYGAVNHRYKEATFAIIANSHFKRKTRKREVKKQVRKLLKDFQSDEVADRKK